MAVAFGHTPQGGAADSPVLGRAELLGERLPALLVDAERVASTVSQGIHGRRRVGTGETFWQYRAYDAGDAAGAIDWRRSARSDSLYVRETEWEAAQSIWLWRDASPSMRYSSERPLPAKIERAELLLLALAALLLRGGERVGLLGADRGVPGVGRVTLERLGAELLSGTAADGALPPPQRLPRHCHVVLIGDFLTELDAVRDHVATYAERGVKGVLLQILDPAEETLPFKGRVRFTGLEEEGATLVNRVESLRKAYTERLAAQRAGLREIASKTGWLYLLHHTDKPAEAALLTLYEALAEGPR